MYKPVLNRYTVLLRAESLLKSKGIGGTRCLSSLYPLDRSTFITADAQKCTDIDQRPLFRGNAIFLPIHHGSRFYATKSATFPANQELTNQIEPHAIDEPISDKRKSVAEAMRTLDLYDHREGYRNKSFRELLLAFVMIRLCTFEFLFKHHLKLLKVLRFFLRGPLFRALMRRTLYAQFIAGETREAVIRNIARVSQFGILPLMGYTASESHGATMDVKKYNSEEERFEANIQSMKESFLIGRDCQEFLHENVAGTTPRCTGKLTFLRPHEYLISATDLIEFNWTFLRNNNDPAIAATVNDIAATLPMTSMRNANTEGLLMNMDFHFAFYDALKQNKEYGLKMDIDGCKKGIEEIADVLDDLAKSAREAGVCLVWDAEQTYLQPAIDILVVDSMRKHNRDRVVVYNTYQCYLKKTLGNIQRDAAIAEREGFSFGAKVVRGAYLDEERRLATEKNYEDPICPTYDATTASYYGVGDFLIRELKQRPRGQMHVIFGSHNDKTILYLLDRMKKAGLENDRDLFWLAQVYGLKDYIAYQIAQSGIPAAKVLQYGDIEAGLAYMSRRVNENRQALDIESGKLECALLEKELKRRLMSQAGLPAGKLMQYGDIEAGLAYMSRRVNENKQALDIESGKLECALLGKELKRRFMRRA